MAAFTVSSGGVTKWDSQSGGSVNATLDTYTISNGSTLLIDTDTYQCAGHSTAFGSLDTVSFSGTGGTLRISPLAVRVVAFNTGTGTVPAIGTVISQGGVSGTLLGVWANWQSEPLAAAAAMPTTGFLKIKDKTGGNYAAGALTGISATAASADVQGWIEVRGADTATITVPRVGAFDIDGAWFELGTTNGTRNQIIPCPTTATVAGVFPGVWIETGAGTGIYERFAGAGSIVAAATIPTDERGKIVWQTTGGIRIGFDGTNNVGFLPPTGCRVRIPAVILTCCTRTAGGSGPRVLPNATLATRQELVTTSAGDFTIDGAVCNWFLNFSQAFRANIINSAISDSLVLSEIAAPINVQNTIVAPTQAQLNLALNMSSCFGGGAITDCLFARFSLAASGAYVNQCNFITGITFTRVKSLTLTNRANATTGTWTVTQSVNCTWTDCVDIGGRNLHIGSQKPIFNNHGYADNFAGTTGTGNAHYAIEFTIGSASPIVTGMNFLGLTNVQPYNGLVSASASYNLSVKEIGTFASPFNLGATNGAGVIFNGAGNNDGILLQKLFVSNTRTGPYQFLNSDTNITMENVRGDFADTSAIASLNTIAKGVALTGSTSGQTAVYGTHWKDSFTSLTVGKVEILCNEPTTASAAQCSVTSGTPAFNSLGQVAMTLVGQQVTWEMPYFAKGHTALANLAPTPTGTNTGNLTYEFQYDFGAGYNGSWLVLNAANLTGAGAINPAIGFRLKVRATCATANAGNLLTQIAIPTVSTSIAQSSNLYPLIQAARTFSFTGLTVGTEVVLFDSSNTEVNRLVIGSSTYTYNYVWNSDTGNQTGLYALIWKDNRVPIVFSGINLENANQSIPISQSTDLVYAVSTAKSTFNTGSSLQILNAAVTDITVSELYSDWKSWLRLTNNAQFPFAYNSLGGNLISGSTTIPFFAFLTNGWLIRPQEANHTLNVTEGILVAPSDPFVNTVGSFTVRINYQQPVQAFTVSSGGTIAPTQQQIRDAMALSTAASIVAGSIDDKIKTVNDGVKLASLLIPHTVNP